MRTLTLRLHARLCALLQHSEEDLKQSQQHLGLSDPEHMTGIPNRTPSVYPRPPINIHVPPHGKDFSGLHRIPL